MLTLRQDNVILIYLFIKNVKETHSKCVETNHSANTFDLGENICFAEWLIIHVKIIICLKKGWQPSNRYNLFFSSSYTFIQFILLSELKFVVC